ncbi:hypothetical protein Tco_1461086, partial [Tanacetum coccineum]
MDRLPSRANLLNRGVEIECARCVLCDMENKVKTVEHCTSIRDISLIKGASIENKWVAKCFHEICSPTSRKCTWPPQFETFIALVLPAREHE